MSSLLLPNLNDQSYSYIEVELQSVRNTNYLDRFYVWRIVNPHGSYLEYLRIIKKDDLPEREFVKDDGI